MPFGDGTGPRGMGPMTGRGAGFCAGFGAPGFANPMLGGGMWRGMGMRMGWGMGRGRGIGWGMGRGRGIGWRGSYAYPFAGGYGPAIPYTGYGYSYYAPGDVPAYGYPYRYP